MVSNNFLTNLPFIGAFFKEKTVIVDTPPNSTPIPEGAGILDTTPITILPDTPIIKTAPEATLPPKKSSFKP